MNTLKLNTINMKRVAGSRLGRGTIALLVLVGSLVVLAQTPPPHAPARQTSPVTFSPIAPATTVHAASASTVPASVPQRDGYACAPAQIREFLIKAEAADKIEDPLARCLAFPDLPGNHWQVGLAKADCEFYFEPRVTLELAKGLIDRGALRQLDARFEADLERHFSKTDFSEAIHADFGAFDNRYEVGRLTKIWLEKAPQSAYALAVRGAYFRAMAWQARGDKWASDTPRENLARMSEFADLSVDLYQRALKIEPRLLPAYIGLMDIGNMDSRPELAQSALNAAKAIDPACQSVSRFEMIALEPRWGGSYEQMLQLSQEIAPFVSQRPLLALNTVWPYVDQGNRLLANEHYSEAIGVLKPIILLTTHPKPYEDLAVAMQSVPGSDQWEVLMYLVAAARYSDGRAYISYSRGGMLTNMAGKYEWAMKYYKSAVQDEPDNTYAHFHLAFGYKNTKKYPEAEAEYLIAMQNKDLRRDSLDALVSMFVWNQQWQKARDYVETLNLEFPGYAQGWLLRVRVLNELHADGVREAQQKFVDTADRRNPNIRLEAEGMERILKSTNAPAPQKH